MKDAAKLIEEHRVALQLRQLQTLLELDSSQSTAIVFPAPIGLIKPFLDRAPQSRPSNPSVAPEHRHAA